MKKCPECEREVDKIGVVCEYCGKLDQLQKESEEREGSKNQSSND